MTLTVNKHVSLQAFNTLAVDAYADYLIPIETSEDIPEAVTFAKQQQLPLMVLGAGSNIVFSNHFTGVVLQMRTQGKRVRFEGEAVLIDVAAGENWHELVMYCLGQGYYGIENLALIPGTVGAAPIQNIGAYGIELQSVVDSVTGWHTEREQWLTLTCAQCEFGYRDSIFKRSLKDCFIVTSVSLRLKTQATVNTSYASLSDYLREHDLTQADPQQVADAVITLRQAKLPDPSLIPNAGSFFKNPVVTNEHYQLLLQQYPQLVAYPTVDGQRKLAAGWLLESAGWKGFRRGAVGWHADQALVLVNPGRGSGAELIALANEVRQDVRTKFGVELDIEPRVY